MFFSNNGKGVGGSRNNTSHTSGNHHNPFMGTDPKSFMRRNEVGGEGSFSMMGEKYMEGDALRPQPFNKREAKEKGKYPIHSDIQEIHDKMQGLYVIGSSLVEQKTMDITDTEYATKIPIGMSIITFKAIGFIMMYILGFAFVNFLFCFVIPQLAKSIGYNPLLSFLALPMVFSIFFYKYFILSMKQYVIKDEEQARTTKFYGIVKGVWYPVEIMLYLTTFVCVFAYWRLEAWFKFVQPYWQKIGNVLHLKTMSEPLISVVGGEMQKNEYIFGYFANFAMFFCIVTLAYVVFSYLIGKKFEELRRDNYLNLLIQHDSEKAVDKILDGEI